MSAKTHSNLSGQAQWLSRYTCGWQGKTLTQQQLPNNCSLALNEHQIFPLLFLRLILLLLIAAIHFKKKRIFLKTVDTLRRKWLGEKTWCEVKLVPWLCLCVCGMGGHGQTGWRTDITQDCPVLWWPCCPAAVNYAIWTSTCHCEELWLLHNRAGHTDLQVWFIGTDWFDNKIKHHVHFLFHLSSF